MNLPTLKWNYRLEKEFQWALNKELKARWDFVYKFPDTWYAQKPYDMIFIDCQDWITRHCELKIIKWATININKLEPQQHFYLNFISNIKEDIALVIVWSQKYCDYKVLTYREFMSMKDEKGSVKLWN